MMARKLKKLVLPEHDEQVIVVDWLDHIATRRWPDLAVVDGWRIDSGKASRRRPRWRLPYYALPNGGHRNKKTAKSLKAEGVRAGVPDLCIAVPRGSCHGLYIEMKKVEGGTVEDSQKAWHYALETMGYQAIICRGSHAVIAAITNYLDN